MVPLRSGKEKSGDLICMGVGLILLAGCSGISIQPSCPEELQVGEKGFVFANQENAGKVASYKWEVFPAGTGAFENAAAPDTTFTGDKVADATLRLTASDGLFQVESECHTRIVAVAAVLVTLEASGLDVAVGEAVTLTCSSADANETVTFTVNQVAGEDVELTEAEPGVVTFSPSQAGSLSFECVAEDTAGPIGDPVSITLTVSEAAVSTDGSNDAGTPARDESPSSRGDSRPSRGGSTDSPDTAAATAADQGGDTEPAPTGSTAPDQSDTGGPDATAGDEPPRTNDSPSRTGGRGGR